jgi:hypothetical protein
MYITLKRIQFVVNVQQFRAFRRILRHLFWIKSPGCDRLMWLISHYAHKNTLVRTGVFPLKELITGQRCVRFMNHRSLKPEIFPTPVNRPHSFNTYLASFMQLPWGFLMALWAHIAGYCSGISFYSRFKSQEWTAYYGRISSWLPSVSPIRFHGNNANYPTTIPLHWRFIIQIHK